MISAWMLYAFFVGALSAGAAWSLEALLRSHRFPTRFIWVGSMGLGALWPLWAAFRPEPVVHGPVPLGPIPIVTLEPLTLQVGSASFWQLLDPPLLIVWALATTGLMALGLHLLLKTRRLKRRWIDERARDRSVLISEDWGPGVVGFFNPRIVLPRWCQTMEGGGLDLILDHEEEHLNAGDLRLMILAGLAPVLMPWSLPLWFMWHRLRLAVEGDCDLRVLRKNPRATRAYLELLLEVGRRLPESRMAAAMLSEPERTLERRIRIMTMPFPKKPLLRAALLAGVGVIFVAVACWAPTPTALEEEAELPAVAAEPQLPPMSDLAKGLAGEPTFTPFTVRPDIKNRNAIAQAMEDSYPPLLRDAGIGGTVNVWFFVDEEGITRATTIRESSGHLALDDAALRVADVIEFTPAMNRDKAVPVWIALPITFRDRTGSATDARVRTDRTRPVANPPVPEGAEFTPFTNPPVLLNRDEVMAAVETGYPPLLRDAGVEGTSYLWFHLGADGRTERVILKESSGHEALDEAALRVGEVIRFGPARNGEDPVAVWIALPITFKTR